MEDKMIRISYILMMLMLAGSVACSAPANEQNEEKKMTNMSENYNKATFGSGCFWCTEAVFEAVKGVKSVVSGYAGGDISNPTYREVCSGRTGHAEVVQITYNPEIITYAELLEIFWKTHDPTTLNRQGADVGTQYRSVIFYHNDEQKEIAKDLKKKLDDSGAWDNEIVTEISPMSAFYKAEDYHQNYYDKNPYESYCQFVIGPKIDKFKKVFEEKLKK